MGKLISICIPTYNREAFVGDLLDSILTSEGFSEEDTEVVISDNASTDSTQAVVERYLQQYPWIRYHRAPKNVGADNNFLQVLSLATGDYCWVIGDDDWILPGGYLEVLQALKEAIQVRPEGISGMTFDFSWYTRDRKLYMQPETTGRMVFLEGCTRILSYKCMGYRFGFISANLFNRERAVEIVRYNAIFRHAYALLHIQVYLTKQYQDWVWLDVPAVSWRMDNDSFLTHGFHKRFLIDMRAYDEIYADVLGRSSRLYRHLIASQHLPCCIRGYVLRSKNHSLAEQFKIGLSVLREYWHYPAFWFRVFPAWLLPGFAVPVLRRLIRRGRPARKTRREA